MDVAARVPVRGDLIDEAKIHPAVAKPPLMSDERAPHSSLLCGLPLHVLLAQDHAACQVSSACLTDPLGSLIGILHGARAHTHVLSGNLSRVNSPYISLRQSSVLQDLLLGEGTRFGLLHVIENPHKSFK